MKAKVYGLEPKTNDSKSELKVVEPSDSDRARRRVSDIIEHYRYVLRGLDSGISFGESILMLTYQGIFVGERTKADLKWLYCDHLKNNCHD